LLSSLQFDEKKRKKKIKRLREKTTKIKRGNATAKKILKLSSIADNMKK